MIEKRFIIENERTVCDGFYGKCFVCSWKSDAEEMCRLLNELHEENKELRKVIDNCQFRTLDLLDYIKEKDVVTHQEVKDWWNSEVMK